MSWQQHANCAGMDTAGFFVPKGPVPAHVRVLCAACPAREDCLEHAIKHEAFGFWGGKTAQERENLRIRRGGPRYSRWTPYQEEVA